LLRCGILTRLLTGFNRHLPTSFEQLISPNQQSQWYLNPKRFGGL
jgi:hypothetical protein